MRDKITLRNAFWKFNLIAHCDSQLSVRKDKRRFYGGFVFLRDTGARRAMTKQRASFFLSYIWCQMQQKLNLKS